LILTPPPRRKRTPSAPPSVATLDSTRTNLNYKTTGSMIIRVIISEYCSFNCVNRVIVNDTTEVVVRHQKSRVCIMNAGHWCGFLTQPIWSRANGERDCVSQPGKSIIRLVRGDGWLAARGRGD
jgi:hypothetical protein